MEVSENKETIKAEKWVFISSSLEVLEDNQGSFFIMQMQDGAPFYSWSEGAYYYIKRKYQVSLGNAYHDVWNNIGAVKGYMKHFSLGYGRIGTESDFSKDCALKGAIILRYGIQDDGKESAVAV